MLFPALRDEYFVNNMIIAHHILFAIGNKQYESSYRIRSVYQ